MTPRCVFFLTTFIASAFISASAQETFRSKDVRNLAKQGSSALPRLQDLLRNPDLDIRIEQIIDQGGVRIIDTPSSNLYRKLQKLLSETDDIDAVVDLIDLARAQLNQAYMNVRHSYRQVRDVVTLKDG